MRKEREREKRDQGPKGKRKRAKSKVGGHFCETTKIEEGGCKKAGGGKGKSQEETLGFEVRRARAGFGLLSRSLKFLFSFCKLI